jgi:nucleotidyltransferase AbiEii toxin of type IV toxin-antitoxin system
MDPGHRRLAEIALRAGGDHGLALAGGYAVRAHGMGNRPSGDVDLFMDWQQRADFPAVTDRVIEALTASGYTVTVDAQAETFARLLIAVDEQPDTDPQKMELAADWRAHPPVTLDIGPVLHPDDAVANKMAALYGRAVARDFLDIDAVLTSGRYTRAALLRLAEEADAGFDKAMFANVLGALGQISDQAFRSYEVADATTKALRERFATWRDELLAS